MSEQPDSSQPEHSESGAPIYHHQARSREFELASGDEETIQRISDHIELHCGTPEWVFHELVSDLVHIDIHVVPPNEERDFYTVVTSGMSDRPMSPPAGAEEYQYAELILCLPSDWPLRQEDFKDENNYWPIRALKMLARFPHEYQTWLFTGHTVPNGNPPQPFAENTQMCCSLLLQPILFDPEFSTLAANSEKTVHFLSLIPLYQEEMDFKLREGLNSLLDRFDQVGVSELLDPNRVNVCA